MTAQRVDPDLATLMRDVLGGDLADRLGQGGRGVTLDREAWGRLAGLGLVALTTPEEHGGSGAGWLEAAALLGESAAAARHLPLAETDLMAGWLLREAGAAPEDATLPRTVAVLDEDSRARAVPWAAEVDAVVLVVRRPDGTAAVADVPTAELAGLADLTSSPTRSGQPRADVVLRDVAALSPVAELDADRAGPVLERLFLRGALARATQGAGALAAIVERCVEHTTVREQFGRPLARFQAVQHLVADAAAEAALARAAVDAAVLDAVETGLPSAARVAVARSCLGHAASVVVRNAHQVHGAVGTTQEHPLALLTLPVLDWRGEHGTTRDWDRYLASVVRGRPGALWDLVVAEPDVSPTPGWWR